MISLRSKLPRRVYSYVQPSNNQRLLLSSLSTTTTNSSSITQQRDIGTTSFDGQTIIKYLGNYKPQHYINPPYRNQRFCAIGGHHEQYQQDNQQSRNFSSSSTGNGTDVDKDDEKDKGVQNNNAIEEGTTLAGLNVKDDGQTDLGIPGAQKGGKKLAIGKQ